MTASSNPTEREIMQDLLEEFHTLPASMVVLVAGEAITRYKDALKKQKDAVVKAGGFQHDH